MLHIHKQRRKSHFCNIMLQILRSSDKKKRNAPDNITRNFHHTNVPSYHHLLPLIFKGSNNSKKKKLNLQICQMKRFSTSIAIFSLCLSLPPFATTGTAASGLISFCRCCNNSSTEVIFPSGK